MDPTNAVVPELAATDPFVAVVPETPSIAFRLARGAEIIPGYVLQERIGVGGYGEVWNATAPGGLAKAVKFVYGRLEESRASRELKSLDHVKALRHPFLLTLERIEVVDGHLVVVMEMADSNLKARFQQARLAGLPGIPREELLAYLQEAAEALDYLSESHSLQHLDVKPENLLLVGRHVKLGDFGLLKQLRETSASLISGLTPAYASPEVFDGRADRRSDQYSLAIVYQEMATGVLPFEGQSTAALASQHLHSDPDLSGLTPQERFAVG
jgi:serine/threonine protein kinase